jgi:hypothetical protein
MTHYRVIRFGLVILLAIAGQSLVGRTEQIGVATVSGGIFDSLHFRPLGPASMSGRISDLAVYEANPAIFSLDGRHVANRTDDESRPRRLLPPLTDHNGQWAGWRRRGHQGKLRDLQGPLDPACVGHAEDDQLGIRQPVVGGCAILALPLQYPREHDRDAAGPKARRCHVVNRQEETQREQVWPGEAGEEVVAGQIGRSVAARCLTRPAVAQQI